MFSLVRSLGPQCKEIKPVFRYGCGMLVAGKAGEPGEFYLRLCLCPFYLLSPFQGTKAHLGISSTALTSR